jgi:processive 1,2-diacylglycerol beta-glucosyltransferase
MIKLFDKETGDLLGTISREQLNFLIDQLEEEFERDRDYYISKTTLELLGERSIDPELLQLLRKALGNREGMEIIWSDS